MDDSRDIDPRDLIDCTMVRWCGVPVPVARPLSFTVGGLTFLKDNRGYEEGRHLYMQRYYSGSPCYLNMTHRIENGESSWSVDKKSWSETPTQAILEEKVRLKESHVRLRKALAASKLALSHLEKATDGRC